MSTVDEPPAQQPGPAEPSASADRAGTAPAAPPPDAPRPARRLLPGALLAIVSAAAVGLAGGLGWQLWRQHVVTAAGAAGERSAVDYAQLLTSIDSSRVDEGFDAVLNGATGEFKDTYTKASGELRQLLIDNRATAQGTVVASAIQSETTDTVVVLLMVDQRITNTARPDPRVDRSRMKMTMQKVDGRWLASKIELP